MIVRLELRYTLTRKLPSPFHVRLGLMAHDFVMHSPPSVGRAPALEEQRETRLMPYEFAGTNV